MNKFFSLGLILCLSSCAHQSMDSKNSTSRNPSNTTEVMSCGFLGSSETSRNAVDYNTSEDIDDRVYTLQVDCNKDQVVNLSHENLIVGISMDQVTPAQKGWISKWRKIAIKKQKTQAAKPYICVKYQAEFDPCVMQKNVFGIDPSFSSKVLFNQVIK